MVSFDYRPPACPPQDLPSEKPPETLPLRGLACLYHEALYMTEEVLGLSEIPTLPRDNIFCDSGGGGFLHLC